MAWNLFKKYGISNFSFVAYFRETGLFLGIFTSQTIYHIELVFALF